MKGLVFTQLLAMADKTFGEPSVDAVLDRCPLSSGGAFSAVGNYNCSEFTTLVREFSSEAGLSAEKLQITFGHWMLRHFVEFYPEFFNAKQTAFDMLESVQNEVHSEVRKLYSDVELPNFVTERPDDQTMIFTYFSPRGLVHFCKGLIEACFGHYGETADIQVEIPDTGPVTKAVFTLRRSEKA